MRFVYRNVVKLSRKVIHNANFILFWVQYSFSLVFVVKYDPGMFLTDSAFYLPLTPQSNVLAFISLVAFLHVLNILIHV